MSRVRAFASALGQLLARAWQPFQPEPGTTEGAVMLGMLLLAVGFLLRGEPDLAAIVPGALLVLLGALPALLLAIRRGG